RRMNRRAVGATVIEERVISRAAHRQPRAGCELVVESAEHRMGVAREVLVDVEGRIRTVVDEGLRFACEAVAAEEMDPIFDDWAARGTADLLIRIRQHTMGD